MPTKKTPLVAYACRVLPAIFVPIFASAVHAADTSTIVDVMSGIYSARDVLTSAPISGGFTIADGQVHLWTNDFNGYNGYQVGNISTGLLGAGLKPPFVVSNGFGDPFGAYDAENGLFYAGTYNSSGSGIYRYDTNTAQWSSLGVFESLYGADIYHGEVYASGLNTIWNGSAGQGNQIALYDLTGGSSHDVLVQAGGNSANVALDQSGNLYYASYEFGNSALYQWTAAQVDSVRADKGHGTAGGGEGDLFLTYGDAQKLTMLPGGANGIAVDLAGNVFFTTNGDAASLLMWNASMGSWTSNDPNHYETIATVDASLGFGFFGAINTQGDFLNGGAVYVSNFGSNGLAEVRQTAPEPSTPVYLAGGLAGLVNWRKRRRSRV